ncbi:molybdate ABC transporter substrate-binding protein [Solemya velum gill symbiont]|nr:molybdate ABC transporter substrate-binding protein [Solemya velum gill symbiont]OOZ16282.1 molybdate ABC transporter substrate-binding protein [Solemya velum gill symbiont]OOZ20654.1 molybdate ABC transporter substrate-binding protein [Solemya velum gill symbiont]OOZ23269.1 molybdate ABC transporter substrate-binding protein [Solemya velum gill symbiont]OOZ24189.1 molybdate ABC transporter substrate-binding protein [Solemya velum gill symbiont]OOZ30314.1 molybdate ABC transporter substrate
MQMSFPAKGSLFVALMIPSLLCAETATVAVASNFVPVMKRLVTEFEETSGHTIRFSSGSTGKLYTQIIYGAPYDMFLAADQERPAILKKKNLGKQLLTYAIGELYLCSSDISKKVSPEALKDESYQYLAIANPQTAPYGTAAKEVVHNLGLNDALRGRMITGENIAQTYQFMMTGNATYAFIAKAQVISTPGVNCWQVPQNLYSPIKQDALLLKRGASNAAATELFVYLSSEEAMEKIVSSGYRVAKQGERE